MQYQITNVAHRSDKLHRDAGTYYSRFYADADRIYKLFDSYGWLYQSLLEESLDASKLFFRTQMPILHRDWVQGIELDEATWREGYYRILSYASDTDEQPAKYGDNYFYGIPAEWMPGAIVLPTGIKAVDFCCDSPIDPNIIYIKDEDFHITENGLLYFNSDPFDLFPTTGEAPNRTLIFWMRSTYTDRNYLQDRLGFLTQTDGTSTERYRDFCNLILDSIVGGTNYHRLVQLVCTLFAVPCTQDADEVVEELGTSANGSWLATNKHVYHAPSAATFLYKEGNTLPIGTVLTDAITALRGTEWTQTALFLDELLYRLTIQNNPNADIKPPPVRQNIPLVLERRFLGDDYKAGLVFPNERVVMTYDPLTGHREFPIIGQAEDVQHFWEEFYKRTENASEILSAEGEFTHTGELINPAEFIYNNVLYPRLQSFVIRYEKTGKDRLPMRNTQVFRKLLPPGILFSLLVEAPELNTTKQIKAKASGNMYATLPEAALQLSFNTESTLRAC
jgi:hypothetical protein